MITLTGVTKRFTGPDGPLTAVDSVDLHVPRGSVQGVIGFSGAGKSTLIRMINLLERPDTGSVLVDGEELTTLDEESLRRRRTKIGMVFQQFNLLENLTAGQNVELALRVAGTEATILEMSWFGDQSVPLPLGEAFHARRLTVKSSQVSSVAPSTPRPATRSAGDTRSSPGSKTARARTRSS